MTGETAERRGMVRFGAGAGLAVGASMSAGFAAGGSVGVDLAAGAGRTAGGAFQAGADATLLPAAAFAAGGATEAGAGLGIGAGMSLSVGSSAETGFSALRSQATPSTHNLSTTALLPEAVELPTTGTVLAGGRMSGGGSGGLRAEVGAEADFVIGPR